MVGIHQIQQKSVAKNILKNWHSSQKGLSRSCKGEARNQKTDSTVTNISDEYIYETYIVNIYCWEIKTFFSQLCIKLQMTV